MGRPLKSFQRNLKIPLDKPRKAWYNVNVSERDKLHFKPCPTKRRENLVGIILKEVDTMATKKITKRDRFNRLYDIVQEGAYPDSDELMDFIQHEIDLLDKKNTADRKPTAKQVENEGFKEAILAFMEPDTMYQVSDLVKNVPALVEAGIAPQRVSPMMKSLVEAGKVVRTEDKRKAYFSLA